MLDNEITRLSYSVTRYLTQDISTQTIRKLCVELGKGIAPGISEPITIGILLSLLRETKEIRLPDDFKSYDSNNFPYYAFQNQEDYNQWRAKQNQNVDQRSIIQTTEKSSSE